MRGGDHDQITNRQAPSTSFLSGTRREANDSNIIFDRYKVATKGESECVHLFGGNNRMVGCGVDSKNNSNDDLIYKPKQTSMIPFFMLSLRGWQYFPYLIWWKMQTKSPKKLVPQIF